MKKKAIISIIIGSFILYGGIIFAENSSFNFKAGSEPDGFRDIKWETNLKILPGMRHVGAHLSYKGVEKYVKPGDDLTIGGAKLEKIEYLFWREKFFAVEIHTKGFSKFDILKKVVFEKFGRGDQPNKSLERYIWKGSKTGMRLVYSKFFEKGILFIYSLKLDKEAKEYSQQKAKE